MARRPPKRQHRRKATSEERKKRIVSMVLVFLMLVSLVGIFFGQQSFQQNTSFSYEGQDFDLVQDQQTGRQLFLTEVENQELLFYTLPQDAQRLEVVGDFGDYLDQAQLVVFSTEGNQSYAPYVDELRFGLDAYGGIPSIPATLGPVDGSVLPVLSCANATSQQAVIELVIGNTSRITTTDAGCASVMLREIDLLLFRDLLLYHVSGIIE